MPNILQIRGPSIYLSNLFLQSKKLPHQRNSFFSKVFNILNKLFMIWEIFLSCNIFLQHRSSQQCNQLKALPLENQD